MKSFSATFFIFLYVLAMIRPVFPLFEYVINQDYIAEFLCVNKTKPELACNGKCYLMQKISEQNEEKKQNLPKIAMEEYPIGFVNFITIVLPKKLTNASGSATIYRNLYNFVYHGDSFHPPNRLG